MVCFATTTTTTATKPFSGGDEEIITESTQQQQSVITTNICIYYIIYCNVNITTKNYKDKVQNIHSPEKVIKQLFILFIIVQKTV